MALTVLASLLLAPLICVLPLPVGGRQQGPSRVSAYGAVPTAHPESTGGSCGGSAEVGAVPVEPPPGLAATGQAGRARLAVIIDDWGYGWDAAESFLRFPAPLTVAVLPHLPFSQRHALRAAEVGFDILLHLPMEPESGPFDDTQREITTQMESAEIEAVVEEALRSVPGVVGVSNHMGSKATADPRVMREVLAAVGRAGLFFVDSHTSANSLGSRVGHELGVPTLTSDMFLDARADVGYIKDRLLRAAKLARRRGFAVVIGHVRPATAKAALMALAEIERMGVQLVRVSELFQAEDIEVFTGDGRI